MFQTRLFATLLSMLIAAGCGQSGPLYLPGSPSEMQPPADTPEEQEDVDEDDAEDDPDDGSR